MVDSWRELNPTSRRFTPYSYPQNSFLRIDHILILASMLPEIISSKIIPFSWTDHCAIVTTIASPIPWSQDTTWCINDSTLTHPSHRLEIEAALTDYFSFNDNEDISALTLWEAHKTVICGKLIQQATSLKRECKILFAKLEANFNASHMGFQSNPNATTNANLDKARLDLDLFLTDSADKVLRKKYHIQYLKANKPDTLMARILRKIQHTQTSIRLKTSRHAYTSNPVKILEIFRSNLAKLYSSNIDFDFDKTKADDLFSGINLPTLERTQYDLLEKPITTLEVQNAIKSLKPHKRPGPDGFSATYFKQFSSILSPILTRAFNSLLSGNSFRTETLTSIMTMLPKPRSDLTSWTNYHPISLLNLDIKLLAKIIATLLNAIIGQLIHCDQTGFMPMRQAGDNIRRALLLIHSAKKRKIPTCLISLDIRKPFNSVSWPCMQYILQKWGFKNHFLTWVCSLYANPQAYVKYAGFTVSKIRH